MSPMVYIVLFTRFYLNPINLDSVLLKILSQKGKPAKWVVWYFIPIIFIAIILYIFFLVMAPGLEVIKNISSVIR